jgi:integrase
MLDRFWRHDFDERDRMAVSKRTWTTPSGETRMAWVVRYYDADSKYRTKTFKRERDAKEWEAAVKVDLKKGIHRPDSTSITVGEAADLWLERKNAERHETTTIGAYELHVRLHIKPATVPENVPNGWVGQLRNVKLSRLTTPLCDAFAIQLLTTNARTRTGEAIAGKVISRRMARHILSSFKAILKDAQKRGLIVHNPAQVIAIDTKSREKAPIRIGEQIPDRSDVRAILAASTGHWRILFLTAAFTGMRSSELRGLVWDYVDLDRRVIHVQQRADPKGVAIGPCKSKSGYRTIQIGDDLVDELGRWKVKCPSSPQSFVFPDAAGSILSAEQILWRLLAVQSLIGMKRVNGRGKYTMHSLRHFYASIMIDAGTPPKRLQYLLGHATLAMTMDTYGHLFPAGENETDRINKAMAAVLAV